ncbi:MAG: WG repeat-containing protein, partial [Defluviitaleaceae bacterium]|nr:WG repeat-containing protein [Defluviitaleaceae bacterium]
MKKIIPFVIAIIIFISVTPTSVVGAFGVVRILVEPSLVFDNVYTFREGMAWVQRDRKVGFVNHYGEFVIPMEFDSISHFFCEGLARVGKNCSESGWTYGFIDMTGELVIPYQFSWAGCFHDGVARVVLDGKTGIIDQQGQVVVPFEFSSIGGEGNWGRPFRDGLAVARIGDWTDGASGVIDKSGNIIIPFEFYGISFLGDGLFRAFKGDWSDRTEGILTEGILNKYGEIVVPFEYDHIGSFHEGLAAVHRDGMVGFVDTCGELVIPLRYGSIGIRGDDPRWMLRWSQHGAFEDGLAVVKRRQWDDNWAYGNEMGLIDRAGNVVLPFEFDIINSFSDGLAVVGVGETFNEDEHGWRDIIHTFGVINMYGDFVIPMGEFDHIADFSEGVASARRDGQTGLIDRDGNIIIPFEYDSIGRLEDGMATARKNGQVGLIDRDGNVRIPFGEFASIGRFENGVATARRDDKSGTIDPGGNIIEPFIYTSVSRINDEVRMARMAEHWSGFNRTGPMDFLDNDGNII